MSTIRLATWNLDHAFNSSRPKDLQIKTIRRIDPDILILTETCREVDLTPFGYQPAVYTDLNSHQKYDAAIWSKFQIVKGSWTYDPELAVCAEIGTPIGKVLVYGSIIPYGLYKGKSETSPAWFEHYKSIQGQGNDWSRLNVDNLPVIAGGDFNQTRDGSNTYGTKECIQLLTDELRRNNLTCVTDEDFGKAGKITADPNPKKNWPRQNIDHICLTEGAFEVLQVGAWDHFTESGKYMSDHNGVSVDIKLAIK
jgi:endonuclease/exonuclease/phosphatase family metal-dependent hydrolase